MPEKIVGPFRQCCILVFNDKTEESMENEKSIQYLQPHWMPLDTTNLLQRETLALIYAPEEKKKNSIANTHSKFTNFLFRVK